MAFMDDTHDNCCRHGNHDVESDVIYAKQTINRLEREIKEQKAIAEQFKNDSEGKDNLITALRETIAGLEKERDAEWLEDRCPKCGTTEVYYENSRTGSGKTSCQYCDFEGEENEFFNIRQLIDARDNAQNDVTKLQAEIDKRDRVIKLACENLTTVINLSLWTAEQWLAWLEKEAQVVE